MIKKSPNKSSINMTQYVYISVMQGDQEGCLKDEGISNVMEYQNHNCMLDWENQEKTVLKPLFAGMTYYKTQTFEILQFYNTDAIVSRVCWGPGELEDTLTKVKSFRINFWW